jgi:DNA-3-methyladenine glycosylase
MGSNAVLVGKTEFAPMKMDKFAIDFIRQKLYPLELSMSHKKLSPDFYTRLDTLQIAQELLGKTLVTAFGDERTAGMIVETEAYLGVQDRASHAFGGRFTDRTRTMYACGGTAYVYLCYGIHDMFNVVTSQEGDPQAILVRAIMPTQGIETMTQRRRLSKVNYNLTAGPGAAARALGIKVQHSGLDLQSDLIWIEESDAIVSKMEIIASPRVGVAYAGNDALLPYRFRIQNNPWTSPAK